MKMVKSLLLGSAAGVVAIAGAQAADLPVKAKPVQYVKICSLYGAGFYYIPGTDFCLKLGGWVRAEYNQNSGGSFNPNLANRHDRTSNNIDTWRSRAIITVDVRDQTAYGTVRSYIAMGFTSTNAANVPANVTPYFPRAFIQWAGFTAGLTVSFFDYFQFSQVSNQTNVIGPDSGGNGQTLLAYTYQFGNGLSASISAEEPTFRRSVITDENFSGTYIGANGWPDIVGNIHLDAAWGSAQIMGAIHQVAADYYSNPNVTSSSHVWNDHPNDKVGWAVGGGIKLNLPWLGKGDYVQVQSVYAEGALRYVGLGLPAGFGAWGNGKTYGLFTTFDAVYDSGNIFGQSGLQLTRGFNIVGGLNHHWNSMWQTSVYGGYAEVDYGGYADAILNRAFFGPGASFTGDFGYGFWQIGSRTVWTPSTGLDLSVDVMYNALATGRRDISTTGVTVFGGCGNPHCQTIADENNLQAIVRIQRNFYP